MRMMLGLLLWCLLIASCGPGSEPAAEGPVEVEVEALTTPGLLPCWPLPDGGFKCWASPID